MRQPVARRGSDGLDDFPVTGTKLISCLIHRRHWMARLLIAFGTCPSPGDAGLFTGRGTRTGLAVATADSSSVSPRYSASFGRQHPGDSDSRMAERKKQPQPYTAPSPVDCLVGFHRHKSISCMSACMTAGSCHESGVKADFVEGSRKRHIVRCRYLDQPLLPGGGRVHPIRLTVLSRIDCEARMLWVAVGLNGDGFDRKALRAEEGVTMTGYIV